MPCATESLGETNAPARVIMAGEPVSAVGVARDDVVVEAAGRDLAVRVRHIDMNHAARARSVHIRTESDGALASLEQASWKSAIIAAAIPVDLFKRTESARGR